MWKREYLGNEIIKTINVVSLLNFNFHFRLKSEDDNSDYRNILLKSKQRTFSVIYSLDYETVVAFCIVPIIMHINIFSLIHGIT